jgi:hypothetical protein
MPSPTRAPRPAKVQPQSQRRNAPDAVSPAATGSLWLRFATRAPASVPVSRPDDPAEREADRVAHAMVDAPPPRRARGDPAPAISRAPIGLYRQEAVEVELEPASPAELERARELGIELPSVSGETWRALGGSPYATILPGYSQEGDSCGAASLVSALVIWDREHWDRTQPNSRIVDACNLTLGAFARHGRAAVERWASRPSREVRRICSGDEGCFQDAYDAVRTQLISDLERMRDAARAPGAASPEADYQRLGLALYFLWDENPGGGLSSSEIDRIHRTLGLYTGESGNVQSFDEIFTSPITTSLAPDEFAQVFWLISTGGQHAFLIGRLQDGQWFLSDQGPRPAFERTAATLPGLHSAVRSAADSGQYWLFTGTHLEYMRRGGLMPGYTGVQRLGRNTATGDAARNIVTANAFLGEIDAGWGTIGDRVTRRDYVTTAYALTDAQAALPGGGAGGLIVELPRGVFTVYTTSTVSDANVSQTALDEADSRDGVLARHTFLHTWLRLSTSSGRRGSWFQVY